jgi:hypothetical protein
MRIIGFNGPPRVGKDTLAKNITDNEDVEVRFRNDVGDRAVWDEGHPKDWGTPSHILTEALSMPCRLAAFAFLGRPYDPVVYEQIKDEPQAAFAGETLRRFMIRISEEHLKRTYGPGFYGACLANKYRGSQQVHDNDILMLVTDIGFQAEVDVLSQLVGYENFLLVKVRRSNFTFTGDSRGWCTHDNTYTCHNFGPPDIGAYEIMQYAYDRLGWEF